MRSGSERARGILSPAAARRQPPNEGSTCAAGRTIRSDSSDSWWAATPRTLEEVPNVTEPTTRLLQTFSLPAFDFTPEEARLVKGAAVTAALVLWFAAALIDAWFLLVVPVVGGLCAAAIWRMRRDRPEAETPEEDWSF